MSMMGSAAVVIGCSATAEKVCRLLLDRGASHVGIIASDVENLCDTVDRLGDGRVIGLHANLDSPGQVNRALELFRARAGQVRIVVNSADLLPA